MTITHDKVNHRATDLTSGMVVAWLRDDYPSERRDFWMLAWKGEEREFRVAWDTGFAKIINQRPDINRDEARKLADEIRLWEYIVPMVRPSQDQEFLDNIDVFIALFSAVARYRRRSENVNVVFKPFGVPEKYHREVYLPLSDAGDTACGQGGK